MKTPDEARECWCPYARIEPNGYNRTEEDKPCSECIADKCMAWRWDNKPYTECVTGGTPRNVRKGYCGLAGKDGGG